MTSSNHEGNYIKIKYQTIETVPKSHRKIVERDKTDSPNTYSWPLTFRQLNKKWLG